MTGLNGPGAIIGVFWVVWAGVFVAGCERGAPPPLPPTPEAAARVGQAIARSGDEGLRDVRVEAHGDAVRLLGDVPDDSARKMAEVLADRYGGGRAVDNRLTVAGKPWLGGEGRLREKVGGAEGAVRGL
jgi:hypothetical protein